MAEFVGQSPIDWVWCRGSVELRCDWGPLVWLIGSDTGHVGVSERAVLSERDGKGRAGFSWCCREFLGLGPIYRREGELEERFHAEGNWCETEVKDSDF